MTRKRYENETIVSLFDRSRLGGLVGGLGTSDDSYMYQLSLVVATASISYTGEH